MLEIVTDLESFTGRLVLITLQHAAIGRLRYGVDVRGHLMAFFASVHVYNGLCVDW